MTTALMNRADGLSVVITGATGGIGLAAATELTRLGAEVVITGRDATRGERAVAHITEYGGRVPRLLLADLTSQADVRRLAADVRETCPRLDVLINNAGAVHARRSVTVDGLETTFALNHLATFLLTTLLLDRLRASAPSRVITVSSAAHRSARLDFDDLQSARGYRGFKAYSRSKLANILFTTELARRLHDDGVLALTMHPGVVATGFAQNNRGLLSVAYALGRPLLRTPAHGADTAVWLATAPVDAVVSGGYYVNRRRRAPSGASRNTSTAARLWEVSETLVAS